MIRIIAYKELLEIRRDRRFLAAAAILSLLLALSAAIGWSNFLELRGQADRASHDERMRWINQGEKYPHAAAHYGVFAFKSPRALTLLDNGIQPYVGSFVWLEAHRQNEMLYRPAEDATALQRFGDLTPALACQNLIPLLIIFMAYGAFAREREQGTLQQLMSLGVRPSALLPGKAAGISCAFLPILLPASFVSILAIAWLTPAELLADEITRLALFMLSYAIYFGVFLFLSLGVSARCRSSASALAIMLSFWALTTLVAPHALSDLARNLYPTASSIELKHGLEESTRIAEGRSWEQTSAALLSQYQVEKTGDLPFAFEGAALQADEESTYSLFEKHYEEFFTALHAQNDLHQLGALISPLAGVQLVSMALTGNDLQHHRDFILQAEAHRQVIHTMINDYIVRNSTKTADGQWRSEAGRELWERIPDFVYVPANWRSAVSNCAVGLGLLGIWFVVAVAGAFGAVARIKIL